MARRPKLLTREQLEARKTKAEDFTRNVLGDGERADEIADESLEDSSGAKSNCPIHPKGETRRWQDDDPPEKNSKMK